MNVCLVCLSIYQVGFFRVAYRLSLQQWLSLKSNNSVVVQATRLDFSAGNQYPQNPEEVGATAGEGMKLPVRVRARRLRARIPWYRRPEVVAQT